jgi:hypothetical protein
MWRPLLVSASGPQVDLALAGLEHEWTVLADDLVALRRRGDAVEVQGVPRALALPGDLPARSVVGAVTPEWDGRARRHLPADRLDLRPAPLGAIALVAHGRGRRARLQPLPADLVVTRLLESFASTGDAPLLRSFFPVAASAARAEGYEFLHAEDRDVRLAEAARLLDRIAATW